MAETANTMPPKGLGEISWKDFWKGALITVFPHLVAVIIFLLRQDHLPTWHEWQPYVEISVATFLTYLGKNLGTNNVGELFKADKPTVTVSEPALEKALNKKDDAVG